MARAEKNDPLLGKIHGKIGNLVVKQYDDMTVVTKCPDMHGVKRSSRQKANNGRFKEAVAYAQSIIYNPEKRAAYAEKLGGKGSVFHAAIAEYLEK